MDNEAPEFGRGFSNLDFEKIDTKIIIDKIEIVDDIKFEIRTPGKIWALEDGCPTVVCGSGMVKIVAAHYENRGCVEFKMLRRQFV